MWTPGQANEVIRGVLAGWAVHILESGDGQLDAMVGLMQMNEKLKDIIPGASVHLEGETNVIVTIPPEYWT